MIRTASPPPGAREASALRRFATRWRQCRAYRWLVIGIMLWGLLCLLLLHQVLNLLESRTLGANAAPPEAGSTLYPPPPME